MGESRKAKPDTMDCCCEYHHSEVRIISDRETQLGKPQLLLNSCCGPCSTSVVERLAPDYDITVFFLNWNITDEAEYRKRLRTQIEFIKKFNADPSNPYSVKFLEGDYRPERFFERCAKYADEPEGGRRCEECFRIRLEQTAEKAAMLNFDLFATTLSVSPHKDYKVISRIGNMMADRYGVGFLDVDFKKQNGFGRSVELSKKYGLYRQNYCGCAYSKNK
ncbi:MAG: epoxyqueuosine reductase QueH [Anaerovoracaceae bacterium]|jgi:predicted adenine nucleotide alpha hydrolase (AANH) superfamily ATPase